MVRPDYCAVDHLQAGIAATTVVECFEQQLPQARQRPAPELAVNRRPFAEMFVQVAPGNTSARNPENPIQNKTMISRATTTARTALDHERLKTRPFLVTHQTPDQDGLPKSHLESDTHPLGNPFCQHLLAHWVWGTSADIPDALLLSDPRNLEFSRDQIYVYRSKDFEAMRVKFERIAGWGLRFQFIIQGHPANKGGRLYDKLCREPEISEILNRQVQQG